MVHCRDHQCHGRFAVARRIVRDRRPIQDNRIDLCALRKLCSSRFVVTIDHRKVTSQFVYPTLLKACASSIDSSSVISFQN